MDFTDYLNSKVGSVIKRRYRTGNDFFTEVYDREYKIEVLAVDESNKQVFINLRKVDYVPSGYREGDSDRNLGEVSISTVGDSFDGIIDNLVRDKDSDFFSRYPNAWLV